MIKLPFKRAVILAPHTDDGEFGCGGTISRMIREGIEVYYIAFSDCKESVPEGMPLDILANEMKAATRDLGISEQNVHLLNYQVRYFTRDRQAILEDLVRLRIEINPDVVFTPSTLDIHQDHQTISKESIRAFKNCSIFGYELPWNNLSLPSEGIIKLKEEDINNKIKAIGLYKSQIFRKYSSPEYLKALSITRGYRIKSDYGEAFEIIRLIF